MEASERVGLTLLDELDPGRLSFFSSASIRGRCPGLVWVMRTRTCFVSFFNSEARMSRRHVAARVGERSVIVRERDFGDDRFRLSCEHATSQTRSVGPVSLVYTMALSPSSTRKPTVGMRCVTSTGVKVSLPMVNGFSIFDLLEPKRRRQPVKVAS